MSSLYYEAADVIQAFWNRTASLKTLVYDSPSPKKVGCVWLSFSIRAICLRCATRRCWHSICLTIS